MSEETIAFTADLHLDGKLIAYVKNSGHGGCNDFHFLQGVKLNEDSPVNSQSIDATVDQLLDEFIKAYDISKTIKSLERKSKKCILLVVEEELAKLKSGQVKSITYGEIKIPAIFLPNHFKAETFKNWFNKCEDLAKKKNQVIFNKEQYV